MLKDEEKGKMVGKSGSVKYIVGVRISERGVSERGVGVGLSCSSLEVYIR